ncbi:hypothetical protein JCM6882_001966 [Rhodosporidiobolus microsporus]
MPVPTSTLKKLVVKPYEGSHGFGAEASGIDINTLTEEQFRDLQRAVYEHKVIVLKGQESLLPAAQQELGVKFDPETPAELGHMESVRKNATIFGLGVTEKKPTMPTAPKVNLNGSGTFPAGHHGVERDFTLTALDHRGFHKHELSEKEVEEGHVRFQRWHVDWPARKDEAFPAPVTTIWAHTLPSAEPVTVHWDDGSGFSMPTRPGATAFIDCSQMYEQLTPEQKSFVDNSLVEYPPTPYSWLRGAKADGLGLRVFDDGNETPIKDCPDPNPENALVCPMVWINPITGARSLQVHAIIAWKIHHRTSPTDEFKIIDDLPTVRKMLDELQRPFVKPDNVFFAPTEEGDLLLFYNRGVRHSAVEFPASRGPRLLHQLQLVASDAPWEPKRVPGQPYYLDEASTKPLKAVPAAAAAPLVAATA